MSILSTLNKLTGKQDKNVLAALNSLTGKTADNIEEAVGNLSSGGGGGGSASGALTEGVWILYCSPNKKDSITGQWEGSPNNYGDFDIDQPSVIATDKFDEMLEESKTGSQTPPGFSRFSNHFEAGDGDTTFTVHSWQVMGGLTFAVYPNYSNLPNWDHWDNSTDSMTVEIWDTKDKHGLDDYELLACYEYTGYTYDSDTYTCYAHVPRMDEILEHVPEGTDPKDLFIQLCIYVHGEATS